MHRILKAGEGEKMLLIGNEAMVRGALEAGVAVATTYPGTPASEIGDTLGRLAGEAGIHFEYSINEKAAYEVAYGASLGGVRSMCSMKHLGLNVAGDPFVTSAYVGAVGGFVIVSAGEPGCHTSPNEQDHRYFARMAYVPLFDPSDPQEAYEMMRAAFGLSEKWKLPVLVRPTTRVSHTQGIVKVGRMERPGPTIPFARDPARFLPVPRNAVVLRRWLIERIGAAAVDEACAKFNRVEGSGAELAVVTSGVSACYVSDAVAALGLVDRVRVLRLGMPYPVDVDLVARALSGAQKILVVEELEPFIEDLVKRVLHDRGMAVAVEGKESGCIPLAGELTPGIVRDAVAGAMTATKAGVQSRAASKSKGAPAPVGNLPVRPPILCPGCPHRASFLALKLVTGRDDIFMNDIGCYTLGMAPPFNMGDMLLSMGSSITMGGGFSYTSDRKIVAFIGDSTFFHAGITGLANAVVNGHNLLVVILDNSVTAMTGHQPSPSDLEGRGEGGEDLTLSIEDMVRACGVRSMVVVDPVDIHQTNRTVEKLYSEKGVSVIISRHACPLFEGKTKRPGDAERRMFRVEADLCRKCAQSCGEAACGLEPDGAYAFTRSLKRVKEGPDFQCAPDKAPCSVGCPAGVCIQGFIARAQSGDMERAYRIIRRSLPLASVLAAVCPRPCEAKCVRTDVDGAVGINDIKRHVLDSLDPGKKEGFIASLLEEAPAHGRKVAVVGSGPSGLAAAWELRLRGYDVTVFEKEAKAGGLLRWGIPRFRLSEETLEREMDEILKAVKVETGKALGRDFSVDDLFGRGFEAVFLGLGAGGGTVPDLEGRTAEGVTEAIAFMEAVEKKEIRKIEGRVVVVGGGDAAMDAARTALRLGADEVTVVYRRTRDEMPAAADEIDEGAEEGVKFLFQAAPVGIEVKGGRAGGLVVQRTEPGERDASGRPRPVNVPGSDRTVKADRFVFATGQVQAEDVLACLEPSCTDRGLVKVDPVTMMTARKNVFAGGDAVTGPATVVQALAAGRRAAWGIDRALRGGEAPPLDPGLDKPESETAGPRIDFTGIERAARRRPPARSPDERRGSFAEVRGPLETEDAAAEAARCLSCAACATCNACVSVLGCGAFFVGPDGKMQIDGNLCNGCGLCVWVCPNNAIREITAGVEEAPAVPGLDAAPGLIEVYRSDAYRPADLLGREPLRIHFAGVGGQGTLTASAVVGEAAMAAGRNVIIGALHGMAQRGGMVTNQVIIGAARSPIIDAGEADIVAGFEPVETLRSLHYGREGCLVFMNSSRVVPYTMTMQGRSYPDLTFFLDQMKSRTSAVVMVDAVRLAGEAGNPKALGLVMLGLMAGAGVFPFSDAELRAVIEALSPAGRAEVNLRAFDAGKKSSPRL